MKMILLRCRKVSRRLLIAGLLCGTGLVQGATFSVSPSSVSNTYAGQVALQIDGLTAGETVAINKYLDVNTNGVIDAADWLVQSFRLTDNQASVIGGVTNINVPRDGSPADGAITADLGLRSAGISQTFVGQYLYELSSPTDHFSALTDAFAVVNAAYDQGFTGLVQCNGTNIPYAGVLVFGNDGELLGKTVADGSGTYTIQVAPGVYQLGAFKDGYVCDMGTLPSLALGSGAPITTNVNLLPTTRIISGRCVDATNSGIGLPGMPVVVQSSDNLLAIGFTATNGAFTVPVTASGWGVGVDDQTLSSYGYLSFEDQSPIDTTTGSVSGVAIAFPRGTALFYGTVKDDQDHPLAGLSLNAEDGGDFYSETQGVTDTNGNYAIAVLAGVWHVKPSNNSPGYGSYLFSGVNTNITEDQASRVDFTGCIGTTISGCIRGGGAPLEGINVQAGTIIFQEGGGWDWQQTYHGDSTDSDGRYSLNVPPDTNYFVRVNLPHGSSWLGQFYSNAMDAVGATVVVALTNAAATNIDFNLQQGASVSGRVKGGNVRLSGINVEVGTITFHDGGGWDWQQSYHTDTDSSGNYLVTVPPGTNYCARARPPEESAWFDQFYDHVSDVFSATAFSALTDAPATNINFDLEQGAVISGRVLGDGSPLGDVWIQVGLLRTNAWGNWQWQYVESANTDGNGIYSTVVPPNIAYAVQYMHQDGDPWLRQFYSNVTEEAHATLVTPLANAPATNINFDLEQGAVISGRVLGDGSPLQDIGIQVSLGSTNEWGVWMWQHHVGSASTDGNGDYSIVVPPDCTYVVQYAPDSDNAPGISWVRQFYSNTIALADVTPVTPITSAPATNIDFNLQKGAIVSGRVLGNGNPLYNIGVNVGTLNFEGGWENLYYSGTDTNGNYSVVVPPGTNYCVQAGPPGGSPWQGHYYIDAADPSNATVIAALTNAPVTNINFNLRRVSSGYDAWAADITNGLTNFNDCATGDGYPNLLKYATGSSPTNPDDRARMNCGLSNRLFSLRFNRNTNALDVTLIVEGIDSLLDYAAWNGVATNLDGSWGGAPNVTETGTTNPVRVTVQDTVPADGAPSRFLRLRVTRP